MICSRDFSIEVTDVTECCLVDTTSIAVASQPQGMCYAVTDNRVFASLGNGANNDVAVIDADADALVTTILNVGTTPNMSVYSPVNDRVYIVDASTFDFLVINPNLMTHIATIAPPVGVITLAEPSYDATNNLIYVPGTTATDIVVCVLNPLTGVIAILITIPQPVAPEFIAFGRRVAHCTFDNRIYVPFFSVDAFLVFDLSVQVYSTAGILQTTLPIPGTVSSTVGNEQIYWSEDTGHIYLLADTAVADTPGANAIDPSTGLSVGTMAVGFDNVGCMSFSPDCLSVNILTAAGTVRQFNSDTFASICTTDLTTVVTNAVQMAVAANGRAYAPDFSSTTVHSLHVPP